MNAPARDGTRGRTPPGAGTGPTGPRPQPPRVERGPAVPIGITLIVVGLVLLADNAGWVDAGELLRGWWPLAIVAAGTWWLVTGARWTGAAAVLLGALLLANAQEVTDVDLGGLVFPSLVVLLGAALLNAGARVRAARGADGRPLRFATARAGAGDGSWAPGDLAATAVFGDARLVVSDGGPDLGLDRVTVTALSVFGDVKVDVPAGWRVEDHSTAVFGDVTVPTDQPTYAEAPVVEVHGLVLFGDTTVRYLDAPEGGR